MQENVEINISDTEENFNTWIQQPFIPEGLKGQIKQAGILIVCIAGPRNPGQPTFPVGTEEFFAFPKTNLPSNVHVDISIPDEQYTELTLYGKYKESDPMSWPQFSFRASLDF